MLPALAGLVCSVALVGGMSPATAADTYAPLDRPGPALTPTVAEMDAALTCTDSVTNAAKDPVLLSPGTATTGAESFAWNWEPALDQLGIPWCAIDLPQQALGPIDVAGQYIVHAIRHMHEISGRKVDILGWSQGGMSMRWSLRFWPDTRPMVDDVMGFAGSNHGTQLASTSQCENTGCRAALFHQAHDSEFIKALNSGAETFDGISYTNVYSRFDEVVIPSSGPDNCSSCLTTGEGEIANIQTQEVCPLDVSDHVLIGISTATYATIVDALTHDGPAVLARIPRSGCMSGVMPGVMSPSNAAVAVTLLPSVIGTLAILPGPLPNPVVTEPVVNSEPPVPCYAFATCGSAAPGTGSTPASGETPQPVVAGDDNLEGAAGDDVAGDVVNDAPLLAGVVGTANRLLGVRP
jgi:hypothetical protein